jgi:endo-1,4-beta-xylanase
MKQKIMMLFLAIIMCCTFIIPAVNVQAATTIYSNATDTIDGYNYELWKDYGTTSMSLNGGGKFSCAWSNIGNALFRIGKKFDSTRTYQQLGNISVNYGCNYQPNGNSYLCVYGWTRSPLVEYYIVDSWGSWRPPGAASKGTITVDGGTYDVYQTTRINQPSIDGTSTTFQQYWSVRTSKRTSGTISVTKHFDAWANKGMKLGKLYECALTVEGYQSSGYANVYSNSINVGGGSW